MTSRREMLHGLGSSLLCASAPQSSGGDTISDAGTQQSLPLSEYEPRSMLHVPETHISRARYPVIDITPISRGLRNPRTECHSPGSVSSWLLLPELLPVMEGRIFVLSLTSQEV